MRDCGAGLVDHSSRQRRRAQLRRRWMDKPRDEGGGEQQREKGVSHGFVFSG
jgi:hypothetical protein